MKIGLVSPYDWSYPGGVRDHVCNLANEFIAMGHDVRIMAPASGPKRKLTEKYILKMGGTTPIPINGSIARIMLDPSIALRVRRVLQREHFDVIHVHEPLVPGLSQTVLRCSNTVTVGTFHASSYPGFYSTSNLAYASTYPFLRPLFRRLSGCIAFCSPATGGESLGIVLLEAMASGKPIVASNITGYATVVNNGIDGLLTTPRNSEELAWAIEHLLGHELLRQQFIHASLYKARQYA